MEWKIWDLNMLNLRCLWIILAVSQKKRYLILKFWRAVLAANQYLEVIIGNWSFEWDHLERVCRVRWEPGSFQGIIIFKTLLKEEAPSEENTIELTRRRMCVFTEASGEEVSKKEIWSTVNRKMGEVCTLHALSFFDQLNFYLYLCYGDLMDIFISWRRGEIILGINSSQEAYLLLIFFFPKGWT